MTLHLNTWQFTANTYQRMIETGVLTEEDRVELIEGTLVAKSPSGSRHAACVNRLSRTFVLGMDEEAIVSVQNPVALSEYSVPEPDIALLQPRDDFYADSLPGPTEVLLLIEVAHSSIDYDRDVKASLYAQAGVPETWIVNLADNWVDRYTDPSAAGYQVRTRFLPSRTIAFQHVQIAVSEILGTETATK